MQYGIDVGEDIVSGDGSAVTVVMAELGKCPVGDVVEAVAEVDPENETVG
jgi:hypothetical protein